MDFFRFFFCKLQTFYLPVPYPKRKKKNYKKILQITIYEKSKNFTVIVSQMRVLGKKTRGWGGAKRPPPPAFIGLKRTKLFPKTVYGQPKINVYSVKIGLLKDR